jgi:hypothetical protein
MIVDQLSVQIENKPGELSKLSDLLGDEGVNLKAVMAAVQGGEAQIHLVPDDADKAFEIISGHGYQVHRHQVVAVETPDHPGGLGAILKPLKNKGINVIFLYPAIGKLNQSAVMIVGAEPIEAAVKALSENYIRILDRELFAL